MKIKMINILLASSIIILGACKKEKGVQFIEGANQQYGVKASNVNVQNDGGVLFFRSWDEIFQLMDDLSAQVDNHVSDFHSQYSGLDEDQMFDKESELGWDEYQPFIDFESQLNFKSFREKVTDITNDENLSDQEYEFWFDYPVMFDMRPLLNEDAIIGVSDTVFKFLANGVVCSAHKNFISKVKSVNELNFESYLGDKDLMFFGDRIYEEKSTCYSHTWWGVVYPVYSYGGRNRRVRGRFYIVNFGGVHRVRAETITQYHRGIWRFWRTNISAHTSGAGRPMCTGPHYIDEQNLFGIGSNKYAFGSSVASNRPVGQSFRIRSKEAGSVYTAPTKDYYFTVP